MRENSNTFLMLYNILNIDSLSKGDIINQFINDYNPIISLLSSIFTIIATLIALYTIIIWKKQQHFSIKTNLLMDLEDNYEILFTKYIEEYLWILKLSNIVKLNDEDQKFTNQEMVKLIEDESSKKKKDELIISGRNYEIAFIRAKRFFSNLDNYDYFKKSYLDMLFDKNIDEINIKLTDMNAEEVAKGYLNELLNNKENAIKEITKLRQTL